MGMRRWWRPYEFDDVSLYNIWEREIKKANAFNVVQCENVSYKCIYSGTLSLPDRW